MPNQAYSDKPSDTKSKESSKGGMKNNDGREKGSTSKTAMNDKPVDSMPNEGAPTLGKSPVRGEHV